MKTTITLFVLITLASCGSDKSSSSLPVHKPRQEAQVGQESPDSFPAEGVFSQEHIIKTLLLKNYDLKAIKELDNKWDIKCYEQTKQCEVREKL